ncbi:diaminobutyrate--2-oxoglutarate transaminase family protein [Protofrankia sp. BMG5.30]|uniref:diaminobutyrate--2-oxoglutarate transaminase family protein n=1 Tax=Protofrankia sp. BMG5.30 TaxID=1834514 RepID=UPI0009759AC5|nr:diaminobutyrate--2-oxoglutarate transaminase family protein [Protofrankia sp. BMG5.30]ONH38120.1 aspartate aminotransferase family protein [Protofrankia sp. BMG5.30]
MTISAISSGSAGPSGPSAHADPTTSPTGGPTGDPADGHGVPNADGRVRAEGILARQRRRESSARTYARNLPIVPVHAEGMTVIGADGRRYLDCLSGAGTLALGHNHPVVHEAIRGLLHSGAPLHVLDLATPEKDAFTAELLSCLPGDLATSAKLHFCGPSGADAVEAALKLTQTVTGHETLLAFTGGYHGMTAGALAVTGNVTIKERLRPVGTVVRLPYPYPYRCPFGVGATDGDCPDGARLSTQYIERLLDDPCGGVTQPAAMIVEAVQGEGGVVPAPDDWLRAIRRITAERGIPLILDEVQTGVGRTGAFWAVEHSGITPDVIVMSKAIGGGLPLAVIAYREELDGWAPGAHTGTFRGNQLAMAAGAATLRFVHSEALDLRAAEVGARMLADLRTIAAGRPCVGDVRGLGLMIGLEVVDPDAGPDALGARPADPHLAARVRAECLARGLIVELGGRHDAVVRLLPPLTITDAEADRVLAILADALTAAASPPR